MNRRRALAGAVVLLAGTALLYALTTTSSVSGTLVASRQVTTHATLVDPVVVAAAHDPRGRIERHGDVLTLDGRLFTFVGLDAYELGTWWGTDDGCGADFDQAGLDAFFSSLPPGSVVRTWAWQGAVGTDPVTHARTWAPLDRLVATAARYGDRLILSLGSQDGTCDDGHWHDIAWYDGGYNEIYDDNGYHADATSYSTWVEQVVSRYAGNPTIAMWEPVNEPEADTCAPGFTGNACYGHDSCPDEHVAALALRHFFDVIGGEIHRLDPGSLVESGLIGSGQCGTAGPDAAYVQASPGIDVTSVHDYGSPSTALPGDVYNGEKLRLSQAEALGKPVIVGEMGIDASNPAVSEDGCDTPNERLAQLQHKIGAALFAGYSGALVWDWVPQPQTGCSYDVGPGDPYLSWLRHTTAASL